MSRSQSILWLECVLDEVSLSRFSSVSPASNIWHKGFIQALLDIGCKVDVLGHPYEQIWPLGSRLIVWGGDANVSIDIPGKLIGYVNIPMLRKISQNFNYFFNILFFLLKNKSPEFVVTYNDSSPILSVKFLKLFFNFKWIAIIGDGIAPVGANAYIYQNWAYFIDHKSYSPKFHLDGGLPFLAQHAIDTKRVSNNCIFMYMGALTKHGGILELSQAFFETNNPNIELWITGRGENKELDRIVGLDTRIKNYGFISEKELNRLAGKVTFFVNPRITDYQPNALNYPSKLLHYLVYGKPILSTITNGLSSEYQSILIPIVDSTITQIKNSLNVACNMKHDEYQKLCQLSQKFSKEKTWDTQVKKLLNWLDNLFP